MKKLDLEAIRERLRSATGPQFWRTLEEAADTEEFRQRLQSEFPADWEEPASRRTLLKVMAASLALAGLTACSYEPQRKIVPYVDQPEGLTPGKPLFYATAMEMGSGAIGVLAESHMGRPTKIEGNPQHPASLGSTNLFAQASVLTLWDPDRSCTVLYRGGVSSWDAFFVAVNDFRARHLMNRGAGLRLLTRTVLSPTLASQIHDLIAIFPQAKWHQYEPANRDAERAGAVLAFGQDVHPVYRLEHADTVLALDSDFLSSGPGSVGYAREFVQRRKVDPGGSNVIRLYAAEPMPTCTGSIADHRLRVRAGEIEGLARAIAKQLGLDAGEAVAPASVSEATIAAIAKDLQAHGGRSLVIAGDYQPPAVHALAHAMNHALGSAGTAVRYIEPAEANPSDQVPSVRELVADMNSGAVETLVMLGGNPVYDAPRDLGFLDAMKKVPLRVHAGLYADESSRWCHWHVPLAHYLESWSDTRSHQGAYSVVQPLISPLYGGKSSHEIVAILSGNPLGSGHDLVMDYWKKQVKTDDFETFWRKTLHDGVVNTPAPESKSLTPKLPPAQSASAVSGSAMEVVVRPDPALWDGRFANNGWLQELPKPITKLTWDNAAHLSPRTAQRLGVSNEDLVEIRSSTGSVRAPVWVLPGHADNSVTVHLGYGRTQGGRVAHEVGFDAYPLRTSTAPWHLPAAQVRKARGHYAFAARQHEHDMENRNLVRVATLEDFTRNPRFAQEIEPAPPRELTLYPNYTYSGNQWGMAIDLNACIGCGVCTLACQAENNIPVVGKDQVSRGRIMHWIRVDAYYKGPLDDPAIYNQPVPCMQCENAPCEVVCPVGATVHSEDGLNQMVYNRCVGTRYCSNNCPYKVRRFNFYQFTDYTTPSLKGVYNPDVTVRSRGVMEKCTYCVQRIREVIIHAEEDGNRPIRDGEILTACQQACPTQAITFGNINDPGSAVAKLKQQPRNYLILADLNTRPRTSYLARIENPSPEVKES